MNMITLAMLGWPEIVAIMVIVLVMFGARKVPELMRGLGEGIREFKKATRDVQDEIEKAVNEETPLPRSQPSDSSPATTVAESALDAQT